MNPLGDTLKTVASDVLNNGLFASFASGVLVKGDFVDRYHLQIMCQLTGKCMHDPIELSLPNAKASQVLAKAIPFLKVVMAVIKVGCVVGKVSRFSCVFVYERASRFPFFFCQVTPFSFSR
jgi:hypothetical protein